MAARAALGRAFLASGVTIFGLGAATMVVSSVSMGVARVIVTRNKVSCGPGGYPLLVCFVLLLECCMMLACRSRHQLGAASATAGRRSPVMCVEVS